MEDLERLVMFVADANSEIYSAVRAKVLTAAVAREILLLLEESLHEVFPFAFEE